MKNKWFWLILLLTFLPRILFWSYNLSHSERWSSPDSQSYRTQANNIITYTTTRQVADNSVEHEFGRTVGYPLFIVATWIVSGRSDASIVFWQCVISTLTVLCFWWVARKLLDRRWAFIAALVQSLSMSSLVSSQLVLTESVFVMLLVVQLGMAIDYWQKGKLRYLVLNTILIALNNI